MTSPISGRNMLDPLGIFSKPKKPEAMAPPPPPPAVPTIDEASRREEMSRKFSRRKGRRANIYGGANPASAAPSVATKALMG